MISVIVVTYNRIHLLEKCLDSLLSQKIDDAYEIIVVNNGSSDGTEELLQTKYKETVKLITSVKRANVTKCKELAFNSAAGEIIAFLDDDCIAPIDWLMNLKNSIGDYDAVGGSVLAMPQTRFAWWWQNSLNWLVGINPKPNFSFLPLGSNVAFKRYVLEKINKYFPSRLDDDNLLPYAEDNRRIKQALKLGFSIGMFQDLVVYHFIPSHRLKIKYLMRRSYKEGVSWAKTERGFSIFLYCFFSIPYHLIRLFLLDIGRFFRIIVCVTYMMRYLKGKELTKEYSMHTPRLLLLDTTHSCNLQCEICELWKTAKKKVILDLGSIKKILFQAGELKIPEIALSGGEPLLREDIFEILEYAQKIKLKYVGVLTNGILVERYLDRLIPYLVDNTISLSISLDSLNPQVHNAIRNSENAYEKTTEGLKLLSLLKKKNKGISFNVITIILDQNLEELLDLANFVNSLGANSLQFQPLIPNNLRMTVRNRPKNWIPKERLSILDMVIDDLINFKRHNQEFIKNSINNLILIKKYFRGRLKKSDVHCLSAYDVILIGNSGAYITCFSSYGSLNETSLKDVLSGKQIIKARDKVKRCPSPCLLPCFCDSQNE